MRLASLIVIGLLLTTQLAFGGATEPSECPSVGIVRAVLEKHFPEMSLSITKATMRVALSDSI